MIKEFSREIQNLVVSHESRPAKSNPAINQNKKLVELVEISGYVKFQHVFAN